MRKKTATKKCNKCKRVLRELPFKCRHCKELHCSKHHLPEGHDCKSFKHDKNKERINKDRIKDWQDTLEDMGDDDYHEDNLEEYFGYIPAAKESRVWNNFWTILGVVVVIWFIWAVYADDGIDDYNSREYIGDYYLSEPGVFTESSKQDIPISYTIIEGCSDYMKNRVRDAFITVYQETDSIVFFVEDNNNPNITITCDLLNNGDEEYTIGEATLGIIGYSIDGYEMSLYDWESIEYAEEWGGCINYPATELHEILHMFGFDHNEFPGSIMNPMAEGCDIDSIDEYIVECLKYTYSNGEQGRDCSYRNDVVGSIDEAQYEDVDVYECDEGWYDAINSGESCCPEPNMYVDDEGYCN